MVGPVPSASTFRLWINIDAGVRGDSTIANRVVINSPVHDVDIGNNASEETIRLPGGVNLVAEIEGTASAFPGQSVDHALTVRNLARTEPAENVIVNSYLPPDVEIVEVAPFGRVVAPGRAQWLFERLGPGGASRSLDTMENPGNVCHG